MAKAPVLLAPSGARWQPVASDEVAYQLAHPASNDPADRVPDLAGPRTYTLEELQRSFLTAIGKRRMRLPIHVPGKAGQAYRSGANLTVGAPTGSQTWSRPSSPRSLTHEAAKRNQLAHMSAQGRRPCVADGGTRCDVGRAQGGTRSRR